MVEIIDFELRDFIDVIIHIIDLKSNEYDIIVDEDVTLGDTPAAVHLYPEMKKGVIRISKWLSEPSSPSKRMEASIYIAEEIAYLWEGLRHYDFYFNRVDTEENVTVEAQEEQQWRIDAAAIALLLFEFYFEKHPPRDSWWHPYTYDLIVERANQMSDDFDARVEYLYSSKK